MESDNINDVIEHYFNKQYPIVDGVIQMGMEYGGAFRLNNVHNTTIIDREVSEMLGIPLMPHFNAWAESKLGNILELQFLNKKIIYHDGVMANPYVEITIEEYLKMTENVRQSVLGRS